MKYALTICTVFLVLSVTALGTTYTVKSDGSGDYTTIQPAINAAVAGDSIVLANETHVGNGNRDIDFMGKAITVCSQSHDPTLCIIDCQATASNQHNGFNFWNFEGPSSLLEGVTVTGGYQWGGGVYMQEASPTIVNCIFVANSSDWGGAGMYIHFYSSPMIADCQFLGNAVDSSGGDGGGIYTDWWSTPMFENCYFEGNVVRDDGAGLFSNENAVPKILNCTFRFNDADSGNGGGVYIETVPPDSVVEVFGTLFEENHAMIYSGGGMYCLDADVSFLDCHFIANGALSHGGGLCAEQSSLTLEICEFTANMAVNGLGGGIVCDGVSPLTLTACEFLVNNSGDDGGGMCSMQSTPVLMDCNFNGNTTQMNGGGIASMGYSVNQLTNCTFTENQAGTGGGMSCHGFSTAQLTDCDFSDNVSQNDGGGFFCWKYSDPMMDYCTFVGNSSGRYGGAACIDTSTAALTNCTITDNAALNGGGLAFLRAIQMSTVDYSIISFSTQGEAVYCSLAAATLFCSDVYGNAGGDYVGCIAGQNGVGGNISSDPLYCLTLNPTDPYTIKSNSPCAPANNSCAALMGAHGVGCSPPPPECEISNNSFEDGQLGQIPTDWVRQDSSVGPGVTTWHDMKSVDTRYFDGQRSLYLYAKCRDGSTPASYSSLTYACMQNWIDCPDADSVRLRIRDIVTGHSTYWGWGTHILVYFTDGVDTAYAASLFDRGEGYDNNWYDAIVTGADGSQWFEYDRGIPAGIDKSHMKIGVRCHAGGWSWYNYETSLGFYVDMIEIIEGTSSCVPGDADGSSAVDIDDVVYLISYIFSGGPAPSPLCCADVDCSGAVDIDDVVYLISYIFSGGPAPCDGCTSSPTFGKTMVGDAALSISNSSSNQHNSISHSIVADQEVQALQLDYEICGDIGTIEVASLVDGIQVFHGQSDSQLKIGLLDLYGQVMIPGDGSSVVRISHDGSGTLDLSNCIAVARRGGRLDVTILEKGTSGPTVPESFSLHQNFPNPFNPTTNVSFSLPVESHVRLTIHNIMGQAVTTLIDRELPVGTHTMTWDGRSSNGEPASSGIYFYRIDAGSYTDSRKMMLLK
ncbi:MAG: right-handed parallel beta-helix repeat-containing protein [Candidatus Zixiibacteriota bacterium]